MERIWLMSSINTTKRIEIAEVEIHRRRSFGMTKRTEQDYATIQASTFIDPTLTPSAYWMSASSASQRSIICCTPWATAIPRVVRISCIRACTLGMGMGAAAARAGAGAGAGTTALPPNELQSKLIARYTPLFIESMTSMLSTSLSRRICPASNSSMKRAGPLPAPATGWFPCAC